MRRESHHYTRYVMCHVSLCRMSACHRNTDKKKSSMKTEMMIILLMIMMLIVMMIMQGRIRDTRMTQADTTHTQLHFLGFSFWICELFEIVTKQRNQTGNAGQEKENRCDQVEERKGRRRGQRKEGEGKGERGERTKRGRGTWGEKNSHRPPFHPPPLLHLLTPPLYPFSFIQLFILQVCTDKQSA